MPETKKSPARPRVAATFEWADAHRTALGVGVMAVSFFILLLLHPLRAKMGGDVGLYDQIATDVLDAKLPYRDRPFEYPPYVIPLFLIPRIFGQERFLIAFPIFALLADFIIKLTLFVSGTRQSKGLRGLAPLLLYCVAVPSLASWYLQRYDVWPALICLAGILWFCRGSYALSGAAIAIGIGLKVYPVVFVLPMFVFAARQGRSKSFLHGLLAGLSPLVVLGFFLPWWRFAQFQAARGLQVESIYASILWFGKLMGLYHLTWEQTKACNCKEVHGAIAAAVLPWARVVWSAGMIIAVAVATAAITRRGKLSAPYLCELLLVPLLSFVAFNQVFSPQFTIWFLPLAALASLGQNSWTSAAILFATMVTPLFFPSLFHDYSRTGLGEFETGVLLLRNLLLVVVWISLVGRSLAACHVIRSQRPLG